MIDLLKHIFGLCGDGHPSIIYGISLLPIILNYKNKITSYVKILLQQFGLKGRQNEILP